VKLAKHINNYFNKKSKVKYTRAQAAKVNHYLKIYVEPCIQSGTSSVIFMVIAFQYLMVENKHLETCKIFSVHRKMIEDIVNELETTENRDHIFRHYKIFVKGMLNGEEVPSKFYKIIEEQKDD
jgi:hypothetical protein